MRIAAPIALGAIAGQLVVYRSDVVRAGNDDAALVLTVLAFGCCVLAFLLRGWVVRGGA